MKLEIGRDSLIIYPEQKTYADSSQNNLETTFIEEVLGLKEEDDFVFLKRKNVMGMSCLARLQTEKPRGKVSSIEYDDGSADLFLDLSDDLVNDLRKEARRQVVSVEELVREILQKEVERNA